MLHLNGDCIGILYHPEHILIRGITVNSFGHGRTDGIDIDSSNDVLMGILFALDCQDDYLP